MADKGNLRVWIVEALRQLGGEGTVLQVSQQIWYAHEDELRASGDLFYTWQYEIRWAGKHLRDAGLLIRVDGNRSKPWTLSETGRTIALGLIKTHGRG